MARELILGIESSCDDTAAAVVAEDGTVLSSVIVSQAEIHNRYGGVFPELASRAHIDKVIPAIRMAIEDAGIRPADLHSIGVTRGPGLIGSLMVGVDTARGLADGWGLQVRGVNHLRGHLRSADLNERRVAYPAMILLVSGGHTFLARMESPERIEQIGSTRDDSVGEAYDKVARMLGLGYPGGPVIDRLAKTGTPRYPLPRPMLTQGFDFSFSGLKTAVRRLLEAEPDAKPEDVAASFVEACMDVLLAKAGSALRAYPSESLVVVGGVSASPQLRERAEQLCAGLGVRLSLPPLKWSTDNAAMIALASWDYVHAGADVDLAPVSTLSIERF
ncbi:tRNA (adenosine(37)-N6)-threonylcarbamoyltransferase complex transferase subunit TsaD [Motilibacter deserti]|uniref:tRNA N6-adenosine threonylcarbamoyltransferase n=1 Tax=Motilibacter deserti TaxID=2714956 RepID=A0ABX0GRL2_9ACTN|nr:tRNA (adenosine(37)-N6)-threonylcarbamoyltransferase complex transferase subunit TsaD [Motilibacter deserti]NHC13387.1 tRNA (adenosine(37)-N6)-threonylcarbamoyltransferase complex transferase subunit TsaD [Motilibacter deserti]